MGKYNPHLQGSDHLPDRSTPERNDAADDVERAREADRSHKETNDLADGSGK